VPVGGPIHTPVATSIRHARKGRGRGKLMVVAVRRSLRLCCLCAQNSGDIGAGYEVALKEGGVLGVSRKASRPGTGTKAVKKAATKSSSNPFGSIFGSKDE
jgi:hypothetical protein